MRSNKTYNETSVHDPSVIIDNISSPTSTTYYVIGSHLGFSSSPNLVNWTVNNIGGGESSNCTLFANPSGTRVGYADAYSTQAVKRVKNYKGEEVDFVQFDAHAWQNSGMEVRGNQWAPDVVYNPTMKKWLMYMSVNGDNWCSSIVCLAADNIKGPYVYQGIVVCSGFNGKTAHNGYAASGDWKNMDLAIATGYTTLPSRYNPSGNYGDYWPNCIDPCVFYDSDGKLWIAYGSWSGGIWMFELDPATGLRDYTKTYPYQINGSTTTPGSASKNCTSDPYFGKKIAGGYYVSGEGPYIQKIGDYYYLFMSYGFMVAERATDTKPATGGYEMRIFRSDKPDGPYVDASGTSAVYTSYQLNYGKTSATNRGMRILGAMNNWGKMTVGECAQGHNSAMVDAKGNAYVIYHTKFNNGTFAHQVRVRQLLQNEKGWLVASPFRHTNVSGPKTTQSDIEEKQIFTAEQVAGTYNLMLHPYKLDWANFEEATPVKVTLTADGKITGSKTGTWKFSQEGKSYVTLYIGGVYYYGVAMEQDVDGYNNMPAYCITAVSNGGVPAWLYKYAPEAALADSYEKVNSFLSTTPYAMNAPQPDNVVVKYKCTDYTTKEPDDAFTEDGIFTPTTDGHRVRMEATASAGNYYYEILYKNGYTVKRGDCYSNILAWYKLGTTTSVNELNTSEKITLGHAGSGTTPSIYTDSERGKVLHQYFGAQADASYTRMNNPLYNKNVTGFTVGFWVKRIDGNAWDALFSFFGGTASADTGGRFYVTGNGYIGYNDGNWFDINHPNNGTYTDIPVNQWAFVTVAADASGCKYYVNGSQIANHTWAANSGTATTFNYSQMLQQIKTYKYMYLGMGSWWGSAAAYMSDLVVYDRALAVNDVAWLYSNMTNGKFNPVIIPGDANEDGVVTIADARIIMDYYLGLNPKNINLRNADVDADGKVTMNDANMTLKLIK
ncbi:MAG: family 43 glycosylhydrolase [Prevotella sp.]|nr:family 43 glycosylhydrolase [Candidatus Prevotella equi]